MNYSISQSGYIMRMAEKYGIFPSKRSGVPLNPNANLEDESSPEIDSTKYRSLIGAIIYVSVASRADITYAVSKLSQYSNNPRQLHYDTAIRLLKYLVKTCDYSIAYNNKLKSNTLTAYADASFGTCQKNW